MLANIVSIVRRIRLRASDALHLRHFRCNHFTVNSIHFNIELVFFKVESMSLDSESLTAVSISCGLVNRIDLGHSHSLVTTLILVVAPISIIIKQLCISGAEAKHNVSVVAGLDCSHLTSHCIL